MWSWLMATNVRTTYVGQLISEGLHLSTHGHQLLPHVLPTNHWLILNFHRHSRQLLFARPFYFFFHKELFELQATLEFRGVKLDSYFIWKSMSLCRRKFPPNFTSVEGLTGSLSMINLHFSFVYRSLGWQQWLLWPPMLDNRVWGL
jgi:hypothetical protein